MTLRLNGSSSGYIELDAPAAAGSNTITLPTSNGSAEQFLKNSGTAGELEFSNMVETSTGVGINQSSPSFELQVSQSGSASDIAATSNVTSGTASRFVLGNSAGTARATFNLTGGGSETAYLGTEGSFPLYFQTNGAERMRITSGTSNGAKFLFNCTSDPSSSVKGSAVLPNGSFGNFFQSASSSTAAYAHFQTVNPNGVVGSITTTGSSTVYNTTSDYRLKENVIDLDGAITRVKQLAPKRFNFIADDSTTVDGFLAHEVQTVVPEAITGAHNAVKVWQEYEELPDGVSVGDNKLDEDGNTIPDYQGIDQSKLVPLLTAALKEAISKIETLETKVAALEAAE